MQRVQADPLPVASPTVRIVPGCSRHLDGGTVGLATVPPPTEGTPVHFKHSPALLRAVLPGLVIALGVILAAILLAVCASRASADVPSTPASATGTLAVSLPARATQAPRARRVSLSDARSAPAWLALIPADPVGRRARYVSIPDSVCGAGFGSESSVYRWNGSAMLAQHWADDHTFTWWRHPSTRRAVFFDGLTFTNQTTRAVIVAVWC